MTLKKKKGTVFSQDLKTANSSSKAAKTVSTKKPTTKPVTKKKKATKSMSTKLFTLIRDLAADFEEKPDGFCFSSKDPIDESVVRNLLANEEILSVIPKDASGKRRPIYGVRYTRETTGGLEYRFVVSSLTYYPRSMKDYSSSDPVQNDQVFYENHAHATSKLPAGAVAGEIVQLNYKKTLDNCLELYRTMGCEGCPKPGLECVELNVGYRPFFMQFPYNRKDPFATGMVETGTINEKQATQKEFELSGASSEALEKKFSKLTLEGFSFVSSSKTKLDTSSKQNRQLRAPRDHVFFPKAEKSAE